MLVDSEDQVKDYIEQNPDLNKIVQRTSSFLNGFYSSFGLELMSTVDFIGNSNHTSDKKIIQAQIANWSDRKKTLFSNDKFIDISISHLKEAQLLP